MSEPDLVLSGERVALGPLRRDLAETYGRWINQLDVRFGLGNFGIQTPKSEEAWLDEQDKANSEREPTTANFTIYDLSDRAPIGTSALFSISHLHHHGTFGIMLGERRGQGLGAEATRLTLDWGFHVLGLHNVLLEVLDWNQPAISAYEKAGFRHIGVRRRAAMHHGGRVDVVMMDAITEEFERSLIAG